MNFFILDKLQNRFFNLGRKYFDHVIFEEQTLRDKNMCKKVIKEKQKKIIFGLTKIMTFLVLYSYFFWLVTSKLLYLIKCYIQLRLLTICVPTTCRYFKMSFRKNKIEVSTRAIVRYFVLIKFIIKIYRMI